MEISGYNWKVSLLEVSEVTSSFGANEAIFPKGSVFFDDALWMKEIEHE
ncbi:hypothetical protein ACFQZJ_04135 [Maribacter chungangensis]|uniref:Uncharacterized protein n=1 Tax=Maribacter chungangensis TaxID=1069117 RepID=A0ABW3B1F4_9FLAO